MGGQSAMDKIKGKAREMMGKGGGHGKSSRGQTEHLKGKAKDTLGDGPRHRAGGMRGSTKHRGD